LNGGTVGNPDADANEAGGASTIVDATALASGDGLLRILRHGIISDGQLRDIVGDALADESAPIT
jgi:hypothetical protein